MSDNEFFTDHDREGMNSLWEYLRQHDDEIGQVKTSVAELRVGQEATNSKLDQVATSQVRIEKYLQRPAPKPNYAGWAVAAAAIIAMVGTLFITFIQPIKNRQAEVRSWMADQHENAIEHAYSRGRNDERLDYLEMRVRKRTKGDQ